MIDITKIDISKIRPDGKYVDLEKPLIFRLTPEEIFRLRQYYSNPNIAKDYELSLVSSADRTMTSEPKSITRSSTKLKSNNGKRVAKKKHRYAMAKDKDKYNKGKHKTKQNPVIKYGTKLVLGSLAIVISGTMFWNMNLNAAPPINTAYTSQPAVTYTAQLNPYTGGNETFEVIPESSPIIAKMPVNLPQEEQITEREEEQVEELIDNVEVSSQREIINKYCDIYQINSDAVYNRLVELTDNFSSEDYLANYHIEGVTCKQREVYGSSEEEILLYAVRCMKQLPGQMGVDTSNLYISNGYSSGTDYKKQINDISKVMGLDRCLVYAICQSECGFNSDMFLSINNPAGLKNTSGNWWEFSSTEEGFIETCAEIIKYYGKIGKPLSDTSYGTLSQVRDIHAPLSDGNRYWLDNVWSIYQETKANEQELFGQYDPSPGFGM